jgi:hypothetical protein
MKYAKGNSQTELELLSPFLGSAKVEKGVPVVGVEKHRRKHPVTTKTTNRKGKEKKEKKRRVSSTSLQGISSPTLT